MSLETLGADASVHSAFQTYAAQGLELARVAITQRDQYRLITEAGEIPAEASGALWYRTQNRAGMPVTGDWVAAMVLQPDRATIEAVLPRRTFFSRRAPGKREDEQAVAANIDVVFLVCGLDGDFNLRRTERYLTLAAESGARPVIVLNKADVCPDPAAALANARTVAGGAGVVLATTRTPEGLGDVRAFLAPGRTIALLGSSGAGKSTIVNCLLGEERFRTSGVRESDSHGRHTTTQRELVGIPGGGALIDTPGMRELQLWASEESVDRTFDDIAALAGACRFRDCSHSGEAACAVADALSAGALSDERWNSYRKLLGEARRHEEMTDHLAAAERKRKIKNLHKGMRHFYRLNRR